MRLVIQRVKEATVTVDGQVTGAIRTGLVVFVGIAKTDTKQDADYLVDKLVGLRIFPDDAGKMNLDVQQAGGSLMVVSQFTLFGDCRRGRRPSFDQAALPKGALALYSYFVERVRRSPVSVETGVFQASMQVQLVNDGPVTILMDSTDRLKRDV
jgi:D-aminoacyl-tRNA deacylase